MMENHSEIQEKSISEQLIEVISQLSHNQIRFVVAMQDSTNKKEAAVAIGLQPDTVYRWPDVVDEAIELMAQNIAGSAEAVLEKSALKAAMVKIAGLDDNDPGVRHRAATEILDRTLGKPKQTQEIQGAEGNEIIVRYVNDWRNPTDTA